MEKVVKMQDMSEYSTGAQKGDMKSALFWNKM